MNEPDVKSDLIVGKDTLKPILFSLLILVSGIIIGVGVTLLTSKRLPTPKTLPPGPEYISNRMVQRIIHELHLDSEQQAQLKPIIQKHMKAIDDIRKEARPQISEEVKQMNEEILSILDQPQKRMWQKNMQQMQDHFKRMRQRRGPGGQRGKNQRPEGEFGPDQPYRERRFRNGRPPQPPMFLEDPPPTKLPPPEFEEGAGKF